MRRWIRGAGLVLGGAIALSPMARQRLSHASTEATVDAGEVPPIARVVPISPTASAPVHETPPLRGLDLAHIGVDDLGCTAPLTEHRSAHLTVDASAQRAAIGLMTSQHVPEASIILMDVETGKILAYASHIEGAAQRDLIVEATAPAASVFKVITGAALVESAGLTPETKQCYSGGGEQRIMESDLQEDPLRDRWCTTLGGAMGRSVNTVFARLALKHLKPATLEDQARAFSFNESIPFDVPVQPSSLHLPNDTLGFARTAAGFWNSTLSPMEAAYMSATVARGGDVVRPNIVHEVTDAKGAVIWTAPTYAAHRVIAPTTAQALTTMMELTVNEGTSRRAFHDAHGKSFLAQIPVAGKTGTLTDNAQKRFYTWFTGFAPSRPVPGVKQVAIAVLVVNQPTWHVKANTLAREMLQTYFAEKHTPGVTRPAGVGARDRSQSEE